VGTTRTCAIILEPAEERGFIVHVPALPEVCPEGDTEEEALANAREAIEVLPEHRLERGQPIPARPMRRSMSGAAAGGS
jgi:antitoxin HicB